jgi:hypothetical protein
LWCKLKKRKKRMRRRIIWGGGGGGIIPLECSIVTNSYKLVPTVRQKKSNVVSTGPVLVCVYREKEYMVEGMVVVPYQ